MNQFGKGLREDKNVAHSERIPPVKAGHRKWRLEGGGRRAADVAGSQGSLGLISQNAT
jgi:hypothetical protein